MSTITGDHLRGHLDTMILASLQAGDAHGLAIIQRLEAAGCGLLKLKEGSLYPALYRLEAAGQVKSSLIPVPSGNRGANRRLYRLTHKGRKSLEQGRQQWTTFISVVSHILGVPLCPQPFPMNS